MSDREKLIEEAAKAMADGEHNVLGWRGHSEDEQDWYRKDAAIALSVFEKAHSPTDDEREALIGVLTRHVYLRTGGFNAGCICGWRGDTIRSDDDFRSHLADALAGFRRSEVPEPSAELVQVDVDESGNPVWGHADRQGEPSEAQIDAAKKAINLRYYRTDTREFDAYAWGRLYREMAVDALRAAGEVS